jgi:amiloride-sensitive sodium channel
MSNSDLRTLNQHYPLSVDTESASFTLKLYRNTKSEDKKHCINSSFIIHSPYLSPTFIKARKFRKINFGMSLEIVIKADVTQNDNDLRYLTPDQRQCYFNDEKQLKYFKFYTEENCHEECFANLTRLLCNCSHYATVRNASAITCNHHNIWQDGGSCYERVMLLLDSVETLYTGTIKNCGCLPRCTDNTKYDEKHYAIRMSKAHKNEFILTVRVDLEASTYWKRYRPFNFAEFISYSGGLLGLFAGKNH